MVPCDHCSFDIGTVNFYKIATVYRLLQHPGAWPPLPLIAFEGCPLVSVASLSKLTVCVPDFSGVEVPCPEHSPHAPNHLQNLCNDDKASNQDP